MGGILFGLDPRPEGDYPTGSQCDPIARREPGGVMRAHAATSGGVGARLRALALPVCAQDARLRAAPAAVTPPPSPATTTPRQPIPTPPPTPLAYTPPPPAPVFPAAPAVDPSPGGWGPYGPA